MESIGTFVVFMGLILFICFSWLWVSFLFIVLIIGSIAVIITVANGEWGYIFYFIIIIPGLYLTFPYFLISIQIIGNILTSA